MRPEILRAQKIQLTFIEVCEPLDRLETDLMSRFFAPVFVNGEITQTYPEWVNEIRKKLSEQRSQIFSMLNDVII